MLARRLVFFSMIIIALSLFNNCDNNFMIVPMKSGNKLGSTGDACLDQLKVVYSTTYWPFLRQTCGGCHSDRHGSGNVSISFTSFMTYSSTLIDHQATTAHGGNSLGPQMQPQIDAFKPQWTDANDDYLVCKAQQQSSNQGSSIIDLPLAGKIVPNLASTAANATAFVPLSYDTATEVASNNQMNVIKGTLRIEVKLWVASGATIGLIFRNPTFAPANGSTPFVLSGLSVALDNQDQSQFFTTFKTLGSFNTGVPIPSGSAGTAAIALATNYGGAPIGYSAASPTTSVGLIMKSIILNGVVAPPPSGTPPPPGPSPSPTPSPTVPPTLTFAQLTAAGGLFAVNCVGCHNGNNMAGALNLTSYASAFAKRTQIANRVVSAAAPMPQAGLLPVAQRNQIVDWVNAGAPQ